MNTNDTDKRATGLIIVEFATPIERRSGRDGAPRRRRGDIGEISPVSLKKNERS